MSQFHDLVEENPVIAAVKDMDGLEKSCRLEDIKVIFILFGDICTIGEIVEQIKVAGKTAMVHIDLVGGLNTKEITVDFIKNSTKADGIITTRPILAQRAKEMSMYAVLRFFVIDSMALKNIEGLHMPRGIRPDFIEVLPGAMPKIIRRICSSSPIPVIAGGLISDREDVTGALDAGAGAVSATNQDVWEM